jgi:hypothetical protein
MYEMIIKSSTGGFGMLSKHESFDYESYRGYFYGYAVIDTSFILETPDIPYTLNMKKVESAVTNIVNGRAVSNKDALINPTSLEFYEQILPQLL